LVNTPKYLLLQIKVFDKEGETGKKATKPVRFNEALEISSLCDMGTCEATSYELIGIIVHTGMTLNSGHYVSYVRRDGL
jgi:ubiquitin C-terminal hydrolase